MIISEHVFIQTKERLGQKAMKFWNAVMCGPRQDAYLTIGDSLGVNSLPPPASLTRRVFQAPARMLAGPERCGIITGFRA